MPDITVQTDHPIAYDSPDHQIPHGTKNDNSVNIKFNNKIHSIFNRNISVLDLGCAGGGMVRSFLEQGDLAIGIEGSDFCKKNGLHEWPHMPNRLFTADITKPFQILEHGNPIKFDLITSWEVLEHISQDDLPQVFDNIEKHLKDDCIFVASINTMLDRNKRYHQTIESKSWWIDFIKETTKLKIMPHDMIFQSEDFVRNLSGSFHICCVKK